MRFSNEPTYGWLRCTKAWKQALYSDDLFIGKAKWDHLLFVQPHPIITKRMPELSRGIGLSIVCTRSAMECEGQITLTWKELARAKDD